jgi:branched-subunit amino acid transport protein AzlD
MENLLGYIIFGTGWPILLVGSVWMWKRSAQLAAEARTFLYIALIAFFALGYTCTAYWAGLSWVTGVLPAFAVFLVLFIIAVREVHHESAGKHGSALGAH